jgi:hypothetical protein
MLQIRVRLDPEPFGLVESGSDFLEERIKSFFAAALYVQLQFVIFFSWARVGSGVSGSAVTWKIGSGSNTMHE